VRKHDARGVAVGDVVIRAGEVPCDGESPCLARVMEGGKPLQPPPPLKEVRSRCMAQLARLPEQVRRIDSPERYPVEISPKLLDLTGQ
jgi:nicotinate phosphoribosyltransferase